MRSLEAPRFVLLVALVAMAAGCASADTSARRASARAPGDVESIDAPSFDSPGPGPSSEPAPSHRLRHTITLGDSYGGRSSETSRRIGEGRAPSDGASAAPPPSSPPVYVYPPGYGYYGYGGYGYGGYGYYGYPGCYGCQRPDVDRRPAAKPRPSPDRPPALGEDWSPPPQYGPRFPFKTAPADPWK